MPFALRYITIMVDRAVCCALVVVAALSCGFGLFNSGLVGIWNESTLTYNGLRFHVPSPSGRAQAREPGGRYTAMMKSIRKHWPTSREESPPSPLPVNFGIADHTLGTGFASLKGETFCPTRTLIRH